MGILEEIDKLELADDVKEQLRQEHMKRSRSAQVREGQPQGEGSALVRRG